MREAEVFESLYAKAVAAIAANPAIEQAVAVQTAAGNLHVILNDQITSGNYDAENQFLRMLGQSGDAHILKMAAVWNNGQVDLPSYHLRSRLAELDPRNLETLLLLQGADGSHGRTIRSTL